MACGHRVGELFAKGPSWQVDLLWGRHDRLQRGPWACGARHRHHGLRPLAMPEPQENTAQQRLASGVGTRADHGYTGLDREVQALCQADSTPGDEVKPTHRDALTVGRLRFPRRLGLRVDGIARSHELEHPDALAVNAPRSLGQLDYLLHGHLGILDGPVKEKVGDDGASGDAIRVNRVVEHGVAHGCQPLGPHRYLPVIRESGYHHVVHGLLSTRPLVVLQHIFEVRLHDAALSIATSAESYRLGNRAQARM
mmetsp:Transcript_39843/g.92452  ORF Transcript_39843/g.92452 Transcript_39843/m.92452 type:complete len:253 (+) Transcript_39843:786-1544(+)